MTPNLADFDLILINSSEPARLTPGLHSNRKRTGIGSRTERKGRKDMKAQTRAILDKIEAAHDWNEGQMYSGGGTKLTRTDTCRVCLLRRHYLYDPQNGITEAEYRFSDGETNSDLSMRAALQRNCLGGDE